MLGEIIIAAILIAIVAGLCYLFNVVDLFKSDSE